MIKKVIRKFFIYLMYLPRKLYYLSRQRELNNTEFSIISSDCLGGVIYHNMNQRFNSPTINLFFSQDDFLRFASNLKNYLSSELREVHNKDVAYPVGELVYDGVPIKINFMHYSSFEDAKEKWEERKIRVNLSNVFIIQVVPTEIRKDYIEAFENIPFENKMLITQKNSYDSKCVITHPIFSAKNYKPGKILEYKSWISLKRYMDDIDYIGFLNNI